MLLQIYNSAALVLMKQKKLSLSFHSAINFVFTWKLLFLQLSIPFQRHHVLVVVVAFFLQSSLKLISFLWPDVHWELPMTWHNMNFLLEKLSSLKNCNFNAFCKRENLILVVSWEFNNKFPWKVLAITHSA